MSINKRIIMASILAALIFVGAATYVVAKQHIRLFVNGSEVKTEVAPLITDGRVMVPIRTVAEILGRNVQWNDRKSEISIEDQKKLLTQYAKGNQKVEIWGNKRDGDYWGMKLIFGDKSRNLPFWYNVGNPSYAPQILLEDLNQDGKDELLIILTTGYGTELKIEEAHIFDSESFSRIPLEDWQTYTLKHVKPGRVTKEEARIQIDNIETVTPHGIPEEDFDRGSAYWYQTPAYGQVIRYQVREGKLYAVLPLWFSPAQSAGQLEVRFSYQDGFFQGESIHYVEDK